MLGVVGFMSMGIPSWANGGNIDNGNTQSRVEQNKQEYLRLKIDNAMDLIPMLGKDLQTLDIPKEAIKYIGAHPFAVYYDSCFMEFPCKNVLLAFNNDLHTKIDSVQSISISCNKPDFRTCKEYLDKQIGECYYSGTEPYVAVNGGAVTYFTYYKEGIKYHLSSASARDYYSLVISKGEPKGAPNRQFTGLATFSDATFGMNMSYGFALKVPAAPVDNRETWTCEACGHISKGKFCGECGTPRKK